MSFRKKSVLVFAIFFLFAFKLFGNSSCECDKDPDCWRFSIAPYAWAAGLRGDVGTFAHLPVAHVDISFSDILRHLDGALMLAGEVRKGPISLAADVLYTSLSGRITRTTPRDLFSDVSLDTKYWMLTVAFGYEFIKTGCLSMDAFLGGRIWSITNDLSLGGGLLPARTIKSTQRWMDPLIGVRGKLDLCGGFSLLGWGMIGGFDVSSKLFWDLFGALGYRWDCCDSAIELVAGYRYMSVDYRDVDFLFDVDQFGPVLGVVFSF